MAVDTSTTTPQPVLDCSAPASLRWQREAGADGSVRLIVFPPSWRSELKLAATLTAVLDSVLLALIVADSDSMREVLLGVLMVGIATVVGAVPITLLMIDLLVRRVITVTVGPERIAVSWKRRLWTTEMSWPREPIARIDAASVWGNVTARDREGRTLFTVSPPDSEDVLWLAENLWRELGLAAQTS